MQRNPSLDVIRVVAIFLMLWQHASEYYLIGPELALADREYSKAVREVNDVAIGRYEQAQKRGSSLKL